MSTGAAVAVLLFSLLSAFLYEDVVRAEDINFVVLVPAAESEGTDANFPLAPALESVITLAAEHVNEGGLLLDKNVSLSVVSSTQASAAAAGLCGAIEGDNNTTVAVRHVFPRM